jgi:hypothetical protein
VALSKAAKHFLWLKNALKDLRFPETKIDLCCDNCSAIELVENHRNSDLSKHIDINHYPIQESVYDKILPLIYKTDNG